MSLSRELAPSRPYWHHDPSETEMSDQISAIKSLASASTIRMKSEAHRKQRPVPAIHDIVFSMDNQPYDMYLSVGVETVIRLSMTGAPDLENERPSGLSVEVSERLSGNQPDSLDGVVVNALTMHTAKHPLMMGKYDLARKAARHNSTHTPEQIQKVTSLVENGREISKEDYHRFFKEKAREETPAILEPVEMPPSIEAREDERLPVAV